VRLDAAWIYGTTAWPRTRVFSYAARMAQHRIVYRGEGVVRLDGVGSFMDGTTAYVDTATAQRARRIGGFIVDGLPADEVEAPRKRPKLVEVPLVEIVEAAPAAPAAPEAAILGPQADVS
jgi:hypothetical protein